jgi:hypothetical protein
MSARTGSLTSGWAMSANLTTSGTIILSLASATAVTGSGALANVTFEIIGSPPAMSTLDIASALLNDGAISATLSPGSLTVNGLFNVSGAVAYFSGGPVRDVALDLAGVGVRIETTDAAGQFNFTDVPTGAYTLSPSKSGDVAEITAFDASLTLQAAVQLVTLSNHQRMAADVNRNGFVTAFDAAYILEKSVELIGVPFPGAGRVWDFAPATRGYPLLNGDRAGENFTAVLIGDVSGNWSPPAGGSPTAESTSAVELSLPAVRAERGQEVVLPLSIARREAQVLSLDLQLAYDPARLAIARVTQAAAASGMAIAVNTSQPGVIRIGVAGSQPISADGPLVELAFDVTGPLDDLAPVVIREARANEGALSTTTQTGYVYTAPPQVTDVQLTGSLWNTGEWISLGAIGGLRPLPWTGVDQIRVLFDKPVIVEADDLSLVGSNLTHYEFLAAQSGGFSYDAATHAATWKLAGPLSTDKLLLVLKSAAVIGDESGVRDAAGVPLDAELSPSGGMPSGDGDAGGDLNFRFDVLPGDVDGSGIVTRSDLTTAVMSIFGQYGQPGYERWADIDGNGAVAALDLQQVLLAAGTELPPSDPGHSATAPAPSAPDAIVRMTRSRRTAAIDRALAANDDQRRPVTLDVQEARPGNAALRATRRAGRGTPPHSIHVS